MIRIATLFMIIAVLQSCGSKNKYYVVFKKVDGLYEKSDVRSLGVDIGKVIGMNRLPDNRIIVEVQMDKMEKNPFRSKFTIVRGFFDANLEFELGNGEKYFFPHDTIEGYNKDSEASETVNDVGRSVESIINAADKQDTIIQRLDRLETKIDALYKALGKPNSAN